MSEHSRFGGSKASQWMNCPGSVINQAYISQGVSESSEYAEEGTQAHKVAELVYAGWTPPKHVNREMVNYGRQYSAGLRTLDTVYGGASWTEKRLVDPRNDQVFGTVDYLLISQSSLIIADYKYGAGERVRARDNLQLLYYALLALRAFELEGIRQVDLKIFQPRGERPGWRTWRINASKAFEFGHQMDLAIEAVEKGDVTTKAGAWCRWCVAKTKCRAFQELHFTNVLKMKDGIHTLSTDEIASLLDSKASINQWMKQAETYVKRTITLTQEPFHGYVTDTRNGRTEWTDPHQMEQLYPIESYPELYKTELRTPKQCVEARPDIQVDNLYTQKSYQTLVKLSETD